MISVEKVIKQDAKKQAEEARNSVNLPGSQVPKKRPIWPWILGIGAVAAIGFYFFRRSKAGKNEGVSA